MTTPQHPRARRVYAAQVALAAFAWQYLLYRPNGLIVMLFVCSSSVPLWNRYWPQPRFAWDGRGAACLSRVEGLRIRQGPRSSGHGQTHFF